MAEFTLRQKLRTAHVKRWQIVRVAREQTVAEHMYLVAIIAAHICSALGVDDDTAQLCARWAVLHDMPEVVTGDLNTPVKSAMRKAVPHSDPIRRVELSLSAEYEGVYSRLKADHGIVLKIVKVADLLEAINFLTHEGLGAHAREVLEGLHMSLNQQIDSCRKEYVEYRWGDAVAMVMREMHD